MGALRAAIISGLVVATALGCRGDKSSDPKRAPDQRPDKPGYRLPVDKPAWIPASVPIRDYVGAATCAPCHQAVYDAWKKSPHGRGAAQPSATTVLGAFDGRAITLDGGTASPVKRGENYVFVLSSSGKTERHRVDLVIGSGRQHQVYFTKIGGEYTWLPAIWSHWTKEWLPTSLYRAGHLDRTHRDYWKTSSFERLTCFACHVSQPYRTPHDAGASLAWIDLPINCESCHGPGRAHVEARRKGKPGPKLADLRNLSPADESQLCGQCHGVAERDYLGKTQHGTPRRHTETLGSGSFRADGTQVSTTYQLAGHLLSRCYKDGGVKCSSCHDPHRQTARSLTGATAEGPHSNRQCTDCHRNLIEPAAAAKHSRHPARIRCVDCHMAMSWLKNSDAQRHRTADHSISIPHPQESLDVGTPNACTTCHKGKSPQWALGALRGWGQTRALRSRPWVIAVDRGLRRKPGAHEQLLAVIKDRRASEFLIASALETLLRLRPNASVAGAIEPLSRAKDAQVRARAIQALMHHSPPPASDAWRKLGSRDPDPYVRMSAFIRQRDPRAYEDETIEQFIRDCVTFRSDPAGRLAVAARARAIRGELDKANRVLDLAEQLATPLDRAALSQLRRSINRRR